MTRISGPQRLTRCICMLLLLLIPVGLLAKEKEKIWVIDAGHGGNDHGCETARTMEKDINLRLARRVHELIQQNLPNVKVILTRETDRYISLDRRCEIANNAGADLFLSIHVNAAPEMTFLAGTETFYAPQGGTVNRTLERKRKKNILRSELLAWMMQKHYGAAGRPISRGVKRERYYVVCYTEMPAILTEVGFLTTASEEKYMTSLEGAEEIARCIFDGLKEYDETVEKDKVESTLAKLRATGIKTKSAPTPATKGPEKLIPDPPQPEKDLAAVQEPEAEKAEEPASEEVQKPDTEEVQPTDTLLTAEGEPEEVEEPLLFSVQIFSLKAKLSPTDPRFKGLKDILVVERDGLYKYLCGTTKDYPGARKLLAQVRETFPDAFLVAYKGNRQIHMADAIEMIPKE